MTGSSRTARRTPAGARTKPRSRASAGISGRSNECREPRVDGPILVPPAYLEPPALEDAPHIDRDEAALVVDSFLQRLAGREAVCRLALGRLAARFLELRAHQHLGFVRIGDYTQERLGISARELQSTSQVARAADAVPLLADAFETGRLNWSKLRLIAPVATIDTASTWIENARNANSTELAEAVKRSKTTDGTTDASPFSPPSPEDRADDDLIDGEPRTTLTIHCPARLRSLWRTVRELASRSSGSMLAGWQALEAIAAEAMSGLDGQPAEATESEPPSTPTRDTDHFSLRALWASSAISSIDEAQPSHYGFALDGGRVGGEYTDRDLAVLRASLDPPPAPAAFRSPSDPSTDASSIADLTPAQLDARMRACMHDMQAVDWQMGCLLGTMTRLRLHRHAGFVTMEHYVTERLGISARKARCLKQIEGDRTRGRDLLAAAYRAGKLSLSRAILLVSVLSQRNAAAWIERAQRVTVRRLGDEVNWARDIRDRTVFWMDVDPPPLGAVLDDSPAEVERQIRARLHADAVEHICHGRPEADTRLRIVGPASVMAMVQDVLIAFARSDEAPWQTFERILLHAKETWDAAPRHRNPIHDRDGWRCRVPACSSRRNLQEHHVQFRSQGGGNERSNRISLCAGHHLHGIHQGIVRASGNAEGEIDWQLGIDARPAAAGGERRAFLRLHNDVYVEG